MPDVFYCSDKTNMTNNSLGRKGFISVYMSQLKDVNKEDVLFWGEILFT